MKLNQKQLSQLEKYLDFKELEQADLRNEVFDHMALNIERAMNDDNLGFIDAYKAEIQLWNIELKDYSSWWLGWSWVGPKLMMKKCVKEIKQMYLWSTVFAATFLFMIFLFNKVFKIALLKDEFNIGLGITYMLIFVGVLVGFYKMKATGIETTYRHLYKINAIGFCFMYLVFNPLWSDFSSFSLLNGDVLFSALLHAVLLVFGYHFWALYRKHFNTKKMVLA